MILGASRNMLKNLNVTKIKQKYQALYMAQVCVNYCKLHIAMKVLCDTELASVFAYLRVSMQLPLCKIMMFG
jgi:hypothetical protein